MKIRVNRKGNRKFFVETDNLKFAKKLAKESERSDGVEMEIRVLKGSRWYRLKEGGTK